MAFPVIIPLAIGALILGGCVKAVSEVRKSRPLASLEGSEWAPQNTGNLEQFIAFKQGGEIVGFGGCNNFFGQIYTGRHQTENWGARQHEKILPRRDGCRSRIHSDFTSHADCGRNA